MTDPQQNDGDFLDELITDGIRSAINTAIEGGWPEVFIREVVDETIEAAKK